MNNISYFLQSLIVNIFWKKSLILSFITLCSFSTNDEGYSGELNKKDNLSFNNDLLEKIYIHFDKTRYKTGENMWFKVYLINAKNYLPGTPSEVVYFDIINPKGSIIETKIIKVNQGFGEGNVFLPFNMIGGEYIVRSYTNHMRNFNHKYFFKKKIHISSDYYDNITLLGHTSKIIKESELDLLFFPEGGQIVSGFNNRIGFKANDKYGRSIDLKGEIVDYSGRKVVDFNSSKFGMGLFNLSPEHGKTYKARVFFKGRKHSFDLPEILDKGVSMRIVEFRDHYAAYVQSSLQNGINKLKIFVEQSNGRVYRADLDGNTSKAVVKIPKNALRLGIVRFELFDKNNISLSERLAFFENEKDSLKVSINQVKNEYQKKENIQFDLLTNKTSTKVNYSNVSISITKVPIKELTENEFDIKTYLLLISEITGEVEQPYYYFYSDDPNRKKNLDILMITEDWRGYSNIKSQLSTKFRYEKGITLKGSVRNAYNNIPVIAKVLLTYKNGEAIGYDETISDSEGQFIFRDLDFVDTTLVIIKPKKLVSNKKYNKNNSKFLIEIDSFLPPKLQSQDTTKMMKSVYSSEEYNLWRDSLYKYEYGRIKLDEVEVEARVRKEVRNDYSKKRTLYKEASHTLDFKDLQTSQVANPLKLLQGRVPGFSFNSDGVNLRGSSTLTGSNETMILLDGQPVDDANSISTIPVSEIDFIDVIKGPRTAIYGSRAGNGIVAVYTKDGKNNNYKSGNSNGDKNLNFYHQGFLVSKKFLRPSINKEKIENYLENKESSLVFWKPTVILKNDIKTSLSIGSIKTPGIYIIEVEGISSNGIPLKSEKLFKVN